MIDALHAYLYYSSVFSEMKVKDPVSVDYTINGLCMMFTRFLATLLNACQYMLKAAWDFLQFGSFESAKYGENNAAADLFSVFSEFLWIPLLISVIVLGLILIINDSKGWEKVRQFSLNLVALVVIMSLLPTLFTHINVNVFHNYKDDILNIDAQTSSDKIFYKHTTDYYYIYKKYVKPLEKQAKKKIDGSFKDFVTKDEPSSTIVYILTKKNSQGKYKLLSSDIKIAKGNDYKGKHYKNEILTWKSDDIIKYSKYKSLEDFDINETVSLYGSIATDEIETEDNDTNNDNNTEIDPRAEENISELEKLEEVPDFFKYKLKYSAKLYWDKIIEKNIKKGLSEESINDALVSTLDTFGSDSSNMKEDMNGWSLSGGILSGVIGGIANAFFRTEYFRYRTDFACVWIEMLANIFLYFAASFALLKIAWELVINRIFIGTLAAMDLTGGEKIRRALNAILGLYVSIMFVGFAIVLYNNACDFVRETLEVTDLAYVIIVLMLASITMDTPNIIAKYFGVEIGMRAGGSMLKRGLNSAMRNAFILERTAGMRRMRGSMKQGSVTGAAVAGQKVSPFQKMTHPFAYRKGKAIGTFNTAWTNGKDTRARRKDLKGNSGWLNSENKMFDKFTGRDYGKHAQSAGSRYETPGSFNNEKRRLLNTNPSLNNADAKAMANTNQADKFKSAIYNQAALSQAEGIADNNFAEYGNLNSIDEGIKNLNEQNGNRIFDLSDEHTSHKLASDLNQGSGFNDYKEKAFTEISANAKSRSPKPTMSDYTSSARQFAGAGASQESVNVLASQAYCFDHANELYAAADKYRNSVDGMDKPTQQEALAHVIGNKSHNFGTTPIKAEYASGIAAEMETHNYRISSNQNRAAGAFKS